MRIVFHTSHTATLIKGWLWWKRHAEITRGDGKPESKSISWFYTVNDRPLPSKLEQWVNRELVWRPSEVPPGLTLAASGEYETVDILREAITGS